jgi:hypothetical protein
VRTRALVTERRRAAGQAPVEPAPDAPTIALASWEDWLPHQEPCDLLLTDPPYSTDVDDVATFARTWLPAALAKVKPSGRAYVCIGAYRHEIEAYLAVPTGAMEFCDPLVWTYRNTLGPAPLHNYVRNWQFILHYRGPQAPPLVCPELVEQFAVQDISAPDGRRDERVHPWQ